MSLTISTISPAQDSEVDIIDAHISAVLRTQTLQDLRELTLQFRDTRNERLMGVCRDQHIALKKLEEGRQWTNSWETFDQEMGRSQQMLQQNAQNERSPQLQGPRYPRQPQLLPQQLQAPYYGQRPQPQHLGNVPLLEAPLMLEVAAPMGPERLKSLTPSQKMLYEGLLEFHNNDSLMAADAISRLNGIL